MKITLAPTLPLTLTLALALALTITLPTTVGVLTDPWCRYNAVLCIANRERETAQCAAGYVGSLHKSVALEQSNPLSCG